jgi:cytochrome c5
MIRAATALVCAAALNGCSQASEVSTESLFESRCSVCHNTSIPKGARKTKSQWQECVERMMAKGAKLSPDEKKALISYLAKKYKF